MSSITTQELEKAQKYIEKNTFELLAYIINKIDKDFSEDDHKIRSLHSIGTLFCIHSFMGGLSDDATEEMVNQLKDAIRLSIEGGLEAIKFKKVDSE